MPNIIDPFLIKPVGDHILVETFSGDNTTSSGLEMADTSANTFPVAGNIIASGPESKYKAGSQVMFRRYSLDELKISSGGVEQTIHLLEDSDVLALYGGETPPQRNPYEAIQTKKANQGITTNKNENADEETANGGNAREENDVEEDSPEENAD